MIKRINDKVCFKYLWHFRYFRFYFIDIYLSHFIERAITICLSYRTFIKRRKGYPTHYIFGNGCCDLFHGGQYFLSSTK